MPKLLSFISIAFLSLIGASQSVIEGSPLCIETGVNELQVNSGVIGPLDSCNTLVLGENLAICELTQIKGFVSGLPQSAQEGLVFDFYTDAPNFQGNGIRYVHPNALSQFGSSYLYSPVPRCLPPFMSGTLMILAISCSPLMFCSMRLVLT